MSNSPYKSPSADSSSKSFEIGPHIRTLQIITFALIQGVVFFAAIVLFMQGAPLEFQEAANPANANAAADEPDMMLVWILAGIAIVQIAAYFVVPPLVLTAQIDAIDGDSFNNMDDAGRAERLVEAYRTPHIVACAIAEGAAFLCLVGYLMTPSVVFLGIALFAVVLILVRFPTASKINFWIEDRIRSISTGF